MVCEVFSGGSVVKNLRAMQETQVWSLSQEDPLEKDMATQPRILAWEIPWTEVPGGLQSMGSQKSQIRLQQQQHGMWNTYWLEILCKSTMNYNHFGMTWETIRNFLEILDKLYHRIFTTTLWCSYYFYKRGSYSSGKILAWYISYLSSYFLCSVVSMYLEPEHFSIVSPWSKPLHRLTWDIPVFCCFCPCPILTIRNVAGYFTIKSRMSQISSKSSNSFPFHFKKNSRTLWSFTRLHMTLTLSLSLDYSDPISLAYLQFLSFSLRPDLCKCFPFCGEVFSYPHGKTVCLIRVWSKVVWPIRPCLALLYELEPLPHPLSVPPLPLFFSVDFIISFIFFVLIFTACLYDSDVNFMNAENISFIATSPVPGICSHIADTQ